MGGLLLEEIRKGTCSAKAGTFRDVLQGEIGGGEELLGAIEVHSPDFFVQAAAKEAPKAIFQRAP